jgi:hypothetical protein
LQPAQFTELLGRLGREADDTVTICYQSAIQRFTAKKIRIDLAESTIEALDSLGNNIWYEINPSDSQVRASLDNITQLAALYIDIDYKTDGAGNVAKAMFWAKRPPSWPWSARSAAWRRFTRPFC